MQHAGTHDRLVRFSLFDPPILTLVVYGGVLLVLLTGDLNTPVGRMLAIPAVLGLVLVPIFTFRALGQVLLSSLAGGQLMRFTSGVLLVERVDNQLRYGMNTRWRRYTGGALTAPGPDTDLRRWVIFRELGSFLGITAYGIVLIFVSQGVQRVDVIARDEGNQRLVATIFFGLIVLVITLGVWQFINRQLPRIWRMWRRGDSAQREASIIAMTAYLVAGIRPKDWVASWPASAAWDDDASVEGLYGYRFNYLHALDTGDLERADASFQYLDEHASRLPGRLKQELVDLERPFVEAVVRQNPEAAQESLEMLQDTVIERYRFRRIQSAVALAEGDWKSARNLACEGIDAAEPRLEDGEVQFEAALMQQILDSTQPLLEQAGDDLDSDEEDDFDDEDYVDEDYVDEVDEETSR